MASQIQAESGYAPSGGAKLYYECAGAGPALVFVHAGVSDSRMWDPQFETLGRDYRVVRYDHRGFGKSELVEEPFSLRDDLASVLHHLGIGRAALVGCSMGGAAAIDFALENPETVSALVLIGSGVSGLNDPAALSETARRFWSQGMELVRKGDIAGACELEAKYWIDGPLRDPSRIDAAYRTRARELHRANFSVDRMQRLMKHERPVSPPAIGRLGEIKAPTLIAIGDSDGEDLLKLAERMNAEIRGSKRITICNAAHLPSLEHPGEFNSILDAFLAEALGTPERAR
jgi:pimeloyl-ACP methyl ester carboxylesterase